MSDDTYSESDLDALRTALLGRAVVGATRYEDLDDLRGVHLPRVGYDRAEGELLLDDGTTLLLAGNTGGCICGAGDYALSLLNLPVNAITDVSVDVSGDPEGEARYSIFVLGDGLLTELARFDGSDGNGYYGTGFRFTVLPPDRPL